MATLYIGHTTKRPLTHVQYIRKLHLEPIHLKDADMYEDNTFGADHHHHHLLSRPPLKTPLHRMKGLLQSMLSIIQIKWTSGEINRGGMVIPMLRSDGKRGETMTYFCDACFNVLPVYLCMKLKHTMDEELHSCWDLWHNKFKNSTYIPDYWQGKIRLRQSPAKRHRSPSQEEKASE
ncbi:hypothetical protein PPTG_16197 [Phytophthora nicotianae INRA-310]|uniref:PiggyBac transposable element-derived protein domain-containing protein n=1 Tax=Phytophthora nicotianae (strain INRA-310) TaxID=761204 RepID=W2PRE8_PHYN3|nr:hypothetical protein PPTG_16197 [Phytophthora nicotianae INRA-310]ETN02585.1 hypothetical protein PPTG_16197 [Phytophthora nicotianae INRA-310]